MAQNEINQYNESDETNTDITGTTVVQNQMYPYHVDDAFRKLMGALARLIGSASIVAAGTTNLGSLPGEKITVTGNTTITSFGTIKAGTVKFLNFTGTPTLTYNATSLILPTAANIVVAAGDTAVFVSEGGGNWRCVSYQRATGQALAGTAVTSDPIVAVRAATTANITIATALNNADVLDGVTLATGDLVLVKDQTTQADNGIYVVGVTPVRATAYDTWAEFFGLSVNVAEGTRNAVTSWLSTAPKAGTIGVTALTFTRQYSSPVVVLADGDFNNSAALDILDLTSADLMVEIVLSGVRAVTDNSRLAARVSTNNGSSFDATGYYRAGFIATTGNTSAADAGSTTATELFLGSTILNNASVGGYSGSIRFYNPTDASSRTRMTSQSNSLRSGGSVGDAGYYTGERAAAQSDNAIRVFMASGNIQSGHYTVYSYRRG